MLQVVGGALDYAPAKTVLVVEDEWLIRTATVEELSACGFDVVQASSAPAALGILDGGTDVDIVFTDVQMPGFIDGFGLARWVRYRKPHVKVILTSAASGCALPRDLAEFGPILPKPYQLSDLLQRIFQRRMPRRNSGRAEARGLPRPTGTVTKFRPRLKTGAAAQLP